MKSIFDELTDYRLKVERDGKEIVNVPGIFALPAALLAPKASILGTVAASLLGCGIHLENESGQEINVGEKVRKAADAVVGTAKEAAKTIKEEIDKAWEEADEDQEPVENPESAERPEPAEGEEPVEDPESEAPAAEPVDEVSARAAEANEEILDELQRHAGGSIPTIQVDPEKRDQD